MNFSVYPGDPNPLQNIDRVFYIDPTNGLATNDGLTKQTPVKRIWDIDDNPDISEDASVEPKTVFYFLPGIHNISLSQEKKLVESNKYKTSWLTSSKIRSYYIISNPNNTRLNFLGDFHENFQYPNIIDILFLNKRYWSNRNYTLIGLDMTFDLISPSAQYAYLLNGFYMNFVTPYTESGSGLTELYNCYFEYMRNSGNFDFWYAADNGNTIANSEGTISNCTFNHNGTVCRIINHSSSIDSAYVNAENNVLCYGSSSPGGGNNNYIVSNPANWLIDRDSNKGILNYNKYENHVFDSSFIIGEDRDIYDSSGLVRYDLVSDKGILLTGVCPVIETSSF
jgi:hypothetical protein